MITREEIIEIGSFNKPHGISGEISASFICDASEVKKFSCLIIDINGIFVPFFIEGIREKNDHTLLLKLSDIDSEESAKGFYKNDIFALKNEYIESEVEEAPADFFIGFKVIDSKLGLIGEIVDIDDSTENALFIIEKDDNEYYIPITDDFINDIDEDKNIIYMSLPEGILNL
ncbi:MAG: ribosome maturation factor RimM [Muribaculaceae bacterium]